MKRLSVKKRQNLTGGVFLTPAVILLVVMNFVPLIEAAITIIIFFSLQKSFVEGMTGAIKG